MTRFQDTRRKQSELLKSVGGVSILAAVVLVWCCCFAAAMAEMTIRAEENGGDGPLMREPKQYSRFAKRTASETASSFIGETKDWSGVGRTTKAGGQLVETQSRWGTLIAPAGTYRRIIGRLVRETSCDFFMATMPRSLNHAASSPTSRSTTAKPTPWSLAASGSVCETGPLASSRRRFQRVWHAIRCW